MNGKIEDLIFKKPTILFSQKGLWTIKINNDDFKIDSKDTFSVPLNTKLSISVENIEDCYLNCVSKI
jgi:gentisate 1,2-dioxygenase